jgi:asparagine synthase (glutamine-hydrolysing)
VCGFAGELTSGPPPAVADGSRTAATIRALPHLRGGALELAGEALTPARWRERTLLRPEYVDRLPGESNAHRTAPEGSKRWPIGLLELWLEAHGV